MRWLELSFSTTHEAAEVITDFLSSLGADGVQVMDAEEIKGILADPESLTYADDGFVDSLDPNVQIKAYFAEFDQGVRRNEDISFTSDELYDDVPKTYCLLSELEDLITAKLNDFAKFLEVGEGYLGASEVHEEDWANGWKKYYETLHLTSRLVINPSWVEYTAQPNELVITLDPGSAFGTGTHETTAMCGQWLDELLLAGDSVLDLGAGSGILSIIASKLGAGSVEAVDIDQLATDVASANCRLNQVAVDCHTGELTSVHQAQYDIIVANIIADVITALAADIPERMADDGLFIASGIIEDKADKVITACRAAGLTIAGRSERNGWCSFVFQKITGSGSGCC
ncbi:MAG: 50S ribosomal protein L11 methyltransferase [Eubacteriales bacterium]|nr:50S ribosomal protein L11 methyltransferase [Eubacteriales bacterium]